MRPFIRIFVAVLLTFAASGANADNHARARTAFKLGSQHYNLGEFQQALDAFREAYRDYDDPSFLFNIAQCERQLGHKREAVREYHAYLNNAAISAERRDELKQLMTQLDKELAEEANTAKMPPTTVTPPPPAALTPPVTTTTATVTPAPETPTLVVSAPPPAERKPAYKKWWVWTIVGGVVVAGAAAGLAVALTRPNAPTAATDLGTRSPF